MDTEQIREYRQNKLNRKVEKWKAMVKRREAWIEAITKETEPYVTDWSFVTQPITANSGGRRFARFRERINQKIDKKMGFYNEIEALKSKIDNAERFGVRVKGDKAKERQAIRDQNDTIFKVGSQVRCAGYGIGEITKVNKKTYTIRFMTSNWITNIDKSWVNPVNN